MPRLTAAHLEPLLLMALRVGSIAAKFLLALYTARYLGLADLGIYGLLVLEAAIPGADDVFHLVAVTIVLSILAHSSTDILVARIFERAGGGWRGALKAMTGPAESDPAPVTVERP